MVKILALTFVAQLTLATSVIGILDNQVDYKHSKLAKYLWTNELEQYNGLDDDSNGFIDDVIGWNFIDSSNSLFDFSLYNSFPQEVYKYYEVRAKKTLDTISPQELAWYKKIRKNDEFMDKRAEFSSYTHATHVTCLAIGEDKHPKEISSENIKFLPVRYLGDATKGAFKKPEFIATSKTSYQQRISHIRAYMNSYAVWMIGKLDISTSYLKDHVNVIHGSWGMGYATTIKMVTAIFEEQFQIKDATKSYEDQITAISELFLNKLLNKGKKLMKMNSDILYVFSAGNKKEDTDKELHYPSSIVLPNLISVAASDRKKQKAYFSNYGKSTVSLFAPGIAIRSCSPNEREIPVNGTSQAAPQVSSVAIKLFEIAKQKEIRVSPKKVKEIILSSSDKIDGLKEFSVSGGILNHKRAYEVMRNLEKYSMKYALIRAQRTVSDL